MGIVDQDDQRDERGLKINKKESHPNNRTSRGRLIREAIVCGSEELSGVPTCFVCGDADISHREVKLHQMVKIYNEWRVEPLMLEEKDILEKLQSSPNFEPKPEKNEKSFFDKVREMFS
jgi:hypothetical protein